MDEAPEQGEVRSLRFLRLLVTVLTSVMIVGFIILIGFLVTRFPSASTAPLPDQITLPDGTMPLAVTHGAAWYAIVTADDQILIFDRATDALRQTIDIVANP